MAKENYNATGLTIKDAIQVLLNNDLIELFNSKDELESARDGFNTLLEKVQDQDAKIIASKELPDQTGNDGKFLSTDGTTPFWEDIFPGQTGNDGKFLSTDGTTLSWKNLVQVQELIGDGSTTIDWNLGIKCHFTLGAQDETFTFIAPLNPSPCNLLLKIKQDSVGGRNCIFPSTVKWLGEKPSWSAGQADKTIIISFYFDGVYYWGQATPWEVISYIAFVDRDFDNGSYYFPDKFMQIAPEIKEEVTVESPSYRSYSAGLAVLKCANSIGIVKNEKVEDNIRIAVYDSISGQYIETLASYDTSSSSEYGYPQAVNISPDGLELWFSYTGVYDDDCWMKCTRVSTEETFGQPVEQFRMPGAWKVLWDNSGEIWFAGIESEDGLWEISCTVCLYRGLNLVKKISFESYSTGFAFDDFGNLWVGTYTLDFTDEMKILQQYLLVFSVDKLNNSGVLGIEDADVVYEMPSYEYEGNLYFTGVSDIVYADGYMYISANGYSSWSNDVDKNFLLKIPAYTGTTFASQEDLEIIYISPSTPNIWGWLKAIGVGLK